MKKIEFLLPALFLLIFCSLYFGSQRPFEPDGCRHNRLEIDYGAKGVVKSKRENTRNHLAEIIIFENNMHYVWNDEHYKENAFFDKIEIGDSVYKPRGELVFYIFKKDTIISIDLSWPCDE